MLVPKNPTWSWDKHTSASTVGCLEATPLRNHKQRPKKSRDLGDQGRQHCQQMKVGMEGPPKERWSGWREEKHIRSLREWIVECQKWSSKTTFYLKYNCKNRPLFRLFRKPLWSLQGGREQSPGLAFKSPGFWFLKMSTRFCGSR